MVIMLSASVNVFAQTEKPLDSEVYNLVTSFIGDASTSRGFAWTATADYTDMVLRYKAVGESDYKNAETTKTTKTLSDATMHYYKADVTDLTAGTEYTYQIGSGDEWYGPFEFTTEAEGTSSFSFIGVTDPQASDKAGYLFFEKTMDVAMNENPDVAFVANMGDMVNDGASETEWKMHFESIESFSPSVPYMAVAGNHELTANSVWSNGENFSLHFNNPDNGGKAALQDYDASKETERWRNTYNNADESIYSFDYGNAHFVVLNTGSEERVPGLRFANAQRQWLENDLKEADENGAKWKIVMMHQGVYRGDKWRETYEFSYDAFAEIMDKYSVDIVIQGHDHVYMRSYPMVDGVANTFSKNIEKDRMGTVYTVLGAAANKRHKTENLQGAGAYAHKAINTPAEEPIYCVFNVSDDKIEVITNKVNLSEEKGNVADYEITEIDRYSIVSTDSEDPITVNNPDVSVRGTAGSLADITVLVTYPEVEGFGSSDDVVYLNQLKATPNGSYALNFADSDVQPGQYKITMNVGGTTQDDNYAYQPRMYVVDGITEISKLSDINSDTIDVKLSLLNAENGALMCAQYKDGILQDITMCDITSTNGSVTVSYLGDSDVDEIKLLFWDLSKLKPILKSVVIK